MTLLKPTKSRRANLENHLKTQQSDPVGTGPFNLTGNLTGCIRTRRHRAAIVVTGGNRAGGVRTQRLGIHRDWQTIVGQRGIDSSIRDGRTIIIELEIHVKRLVAHRRIGIEAEARDLKRTVSITINNGTQRGRCSQAQDSQDTTDHLGSVIDSGFRLDRITCSLLSDLLLPWQQSRRVYWD